jgi:hypothetical protein
MTAVINVSKSALFEMVMAAFEAYAVKHQGSKELTVETFAHLWGKHSYRSGVLKCSVNHVSVETSAKRKRGSVETKFLSLQIKRDVAQIFNDSTPSDYSYIGSFHSHPYLKREISESNTIASTKHDDEQTTAADIRRYKLFDPSHDDHKCEIGEYFTIGKKHFSVALIITIFAMDKSDDRLDQALAEDVFEFSMGNVKLWLKTQVFEHKTLSSLTISDKDAFGKFGLGKDSSKVTLSQFEPDELVPIPIESQLECEFLSNHNYLFKSFGRINLQPEESKDTYRDAKSAEKRWFR